MMTRDDVARLYDTILTIPGMNETVKIDLRISRKNVLLLSNVIERGLVVREDGKASDLLNSIPPENLGELKALAGECLQKAGLIELSEKLNSLANTK